MDIIGHRGASADAPENTLASVNMAWEENADAVEVDVHLSADGRVMVIHDASTGRTCGVDLAISDTTSSELRKLEATRLRNDRFKGERIPFLEEVIATIPEGRRLFVEIKSESTILPVLRELIEQSGKPGHLVLIGFDLETMAAAKTAMPAIPCCWLRSTIFHPTIREPQPHSLEIIESVKNAGLDGLDVHYAGVGKAFADAVRAAGLSLYGWTVNDPKEAARLRGLGVDGLTTDCPGRMREQLAQRPA